MRKTDVIKHSATIHISNPETLSQRRIWNVLLANAYDELLVRDVHVMGLMDLIESLDISTNNTSHIKKQLRELRRQDVEWNILGKDKEEDWGVSGYIAEARIKNGSVYYSYGPHFARKLANPKVYARIKLSIQNRFTSKHSLALYELWVDYKGIRQTPEIPIDTFRKLMGMRDDQYPEFRRLNQKVIKPSVDEINDKSDLHGDVFYTKSGRWTSGVKFTISEKEIPNRPHPTTTVGITDDVLLPIEDVIGTDPFDEWFDNLPAKEQKELQTTAQQRLQDESMGQFNKTAALWIQMREIWREHTAEYN